MVTQLNQTKSLAFATGEIKAIDDRPKPEGLVVGVNTDTGRTAFIIPLRPKLILGRSDNQISVDVDLTTFGALEKGVSRKHAMLIQHGTNLYILDLGSTNGTQINGKVLRTGSIYKLKDNDELLFGKLNLSVTFAYETVTATTVVDNSQADNGAESASQGVLKRLGTPPGNSPDNNGADTIPDVQSAS